jgi:hypothetical protein
VALAGSGATRPCEEEPAGSIKRRAGELGLGGAGRAARGQLAARGKRRRWAVGGAAEKQRGGSRRKKRGPVRKFCKSSRSSL